MDYTWVEALAEMTSRQCSEDEQLLIFSKFSKQFDYSAPAHNDFMSKCRRTIGLSPRLNDVLGCLLESLSNKEIAAKLGISHHTVGDYVKQVYAHFMVSSRRELLASVKNGRLLKQKQELRSDCREEQLFQILTELMKMDINICERRRYFFDHFIKLIGGNSYIWFESEFDASMRAPKLLNALTNFSPQVQQLFIEAANDPKLEDPYMLPSVAYYLTKGVSAYLRYEFLDDDSWYNSEYTKKYYKNANTDHPICYSIIQGENQNCGILIYKQWQEEPFDEADRDFMDNVFKRLPWLFLQETQIDKSLFENLTAHQHKILLFLIDGYGKKELAEQLYISENSAHDHIKNIYKIFKVKSYGDLLKLFMH